MNGFILKGKGYPRTPKYAHGESHIQVMFTLLKSCNMKRLTFLPSLEEDLCCAMNYPNIFYRYNLCTETFDCCCLRAS